ncbi:MAG: nickel-dependent lactate racemase [Thermoprotei archaeon]|nr:MAG: nickel-dependent lactate racemase [Thermoprotei archaeon]
MVGKYVRISIPYGLGRLEVELPDERVEVLRSRHMPVVKDLEHEVLTRLENPISSPPLSRMVSEVSKMLIIVPDNTRACPTKEILPPLLKCTEKANPRVDIEILIATGLHKPVTGEELVELLGREVIESYFVENHKASEEERLTKLPKRTSFNTPIEVNKKVLTSDLVLGVGLIEPHFFAGYSGGRKSLLPGVAGANAIFNNHGYKMIASPKARSGVLSGNPVHEDMVEFMEMTKLDFIVNVMVDERKRVSGVFVGDPIEAHLAGVRELDKYVKVRFREEADIVITSNGGYPLDRNIYQAVKGMDTAALVVREGGVIVIASECRDGLGGHEHFLRLVRGTANPDEVLERIREMEPIHDQWEAQILARVLKKARVIVVTDRMSHETLRDLHLIGAKNLDEALEIAYNIVGKDVRITCIPEGPYVIPMKH